MAEALEFIQKRREKIVNQFYEKMLLSFDNHNEVCFATEGTFSFPLVMIPEIHLQALITLFTEKGLYVYIFNEIEIMTFPDIGEKEIKKPYYKVLLSPVDKKEENE